MIQYSRCMTFTAQHIRSIHSYRIHSNILCRNLSYKINQFFENDHRVEYTIKDDDLSKTTFSLSVQHPKKEFKQNFSQYPKKLIQQLLPFGYPTSVRSGYMRFACFQFVASTLGTICGVLSMQSLFHAVGIGSNSTLPLAAAFNWIIKDGIGQLGGVLFASAVNSKFDSDPKRWRFIAACSLDFACFIELLTPLWPSYFLLIASIANAGKNISYLSSSASRAAIHKSFATHENLADVTAKTGSQTILASLFGTSIGISAASMMGNDFTSNLALFTFCSLSGLTATYLSLSKVVVTTLTISKLEIIFKEYFKRGTILSPKEVMDGEIFLGQPLNNLPLLNVGNDIHTVAPTTNDLKAMIDYFRSDMYMIGVSVHTIKQSKHATVNLIFKVGADKEEILLGLFHSYIARYLLHKDGYKKLPYFPLIGDAGEFNDSYVKMSSELMHGEICRYNLELTNGEASRLCNQIAHESEWTIEEMHLESRMARVTID